MAFNTKKFIVIFLFLPFVLKAQWSILPFNTGYKNYAVSFVNENVGYVSSGIWQGPPPGINHTFLYKTINGGNTWQTIINDPANTPISQLSFINENEGIYRRWQDHVRKTANGGVTGTSILTAIGSSSLSRFQLLDSSQYMYSSGNNVYYTLNGGLSWTTKNLSSYQIFTNGDNYVQFRDLKNGFIWGSSFYNNSTEFYIYKTTDSCQTLQLSYSFVQAAGDVRPEFSRMKFIDSSTAIMTLNNLVLKTTNFGTSWDTILTGSNTQWYSMDAKNNIVVIGGDNGEILTSIDSGLTYQTNAIAGPSSIITDISIADSKTKVIYATCDNGHILKYQPNTNNVSEVETRKMILYPNPAQDILHLSFYSPQKETLNIDIFDCTGIFVKSYNFKSSGDFSENINISEFTKGYYILKLKTNSKIDYFKIIKQ